MNTLRKCTAAVFMLSAVGLVACNSSHGPAQTAGKNIDQAGQKVGNAVGNAAQNTGNAVSNAAKNTGQAISDTAITAKVQAAILAKPGLKIMQIDVNTTNGVVTLTGTVNSQRASDRAAAVARNVDGVKSVNNQLAVKPNSSG